MKNGLILIFLILLTATQSAAQNQWYEYREMVMEATMSQPLATKFKHSHPEYFENDNCPPSFQREIPPKPDLDIALDTDKKKAQNVLNILMRNDCDRFITLDALGDFYFPQITSELNAAGLSVEYKFLPLVLSGLNTHFDNGSGRTGAWQLDFVTARKFGLVVNKNFDERFNFEESTTAAISYLLHLEEIFDNDDTKVLLAFYHSPLYVTKNVETGDSEILNLDEEDIAFLNFFSTARDLFESLETDDHRREIAQISGNLKKTDFHYNLSFEAIAKILHTTVKSLSTANPVFTGQVLDTTFQAVPFKLSPELNLAFESLEDSIYSQQKREEEKLKRQAKAEEERIKKGIPDPETSRELIYKVSSGDVIGSIAQRYGVKVSDIRTWNDLRSNMIYIGQELILYIPNSRVVSDEKSVVERKKTVPENDDQEIPSGDFITYKVKSGENLWLIARNYPGVSANDIMKWNGITEDVKPGLELKIYLKD